MRSRRPAVPQSRSRAVTLFFGGPQVFGGTTGAARPRYRVCRSTVEHRIPASRMSALRTNPILAAPAWRHADRRKSAGFIVEDTAGARGLSPPVTNETQQQHMPNQTSPFTAAQSYQRGFRTSRRRDRLRGIRRATIIPEVPIVDSSAFAGSICPHRDSPKTSGASPTPSTTS